MCGRYALGIRASFIRYQLQQRNMPVDDAPPNDEARETYNFPPGSYGLVYRANIPDTGLRDTDEQNESVENDHNQGNDPPAINASESTAQGVDSDPQDKKAISYHLKTMKWGLIPFWTKRSPDYGSMMRTINCRDDSLIENRGMWNTMKHRKRCIVVAQGFYEWLKKGPGGKEKVPHFVKRKDGDLMYFAGLWDCVRYEDVEEKLYTYAIITTNSNKQLEFLHDRMPVILDPDTDAMRLWLDPTVNKWSDKLQSLLEPFEGELECYPVNKEVGKVGNNSPDFIIPVDSRENKKNIVNFFDNAKKKDTNTSPKADVKIEDNDTRETKDCDTSETHAPMPIPSKAEGGTKRKANHIQDEGDHIEKAVKLESGSQQPRDVSSPSKSSTPQKMASTKKTRSATSNEGLSKKPSPIKADGSQRITSFFGKVDT